jgi:hypothetical protein
MLPSHWPKWALFFVALTLIVACVVVALLMVPIGKALSPTVTPEPTLPAISYARPLSTECEACHLDRVALAASGADPEEIESLYIEPESLETTHGSLGCITCHGGTSDAPDKDAAHDNLMLDLSETHPEDCLLCHRNLPDYFPEDNLNTPHGQISNAVWEGSACGVLCSDCHGQVGHGFDPVTGETICPMTVCVDCHQEQNLDASLSECSACHEDSHGVADGQSCEGCHSSTDAWVDITVEEHSPELVGEHATLGCFTCHRWPSFGGLEESCAECHERPHEEQTDQCALCHRPEGWETSGAATLSRAMDTPHPAEEDLDCLECHGLFEAYAMPDDHEGRTSGDCRVCHMPEPATLVWHPLEDNEFCRDCHDEYGIAPYPYTTHRDYGNDICTACHAPAGIEPPSVLHTVAERGDCLLCHGPVRIEPFPQNHSGRTNEMCLLCHDAQDTPTRTEHSFSLNHNGAGENCELCHPRKDFSTFSCETCHNQITVETIHVERGIKLEEDCTICHPEGKKPLNSG